MKRLLPLLLVLVAMFALVIPVIHANPDNTVSDPSECPVGTIANDVGDGRWECIPDPNQNNNENNNTENNNTENNNPPVVKVTEPVPTPKPTKPGVSFNDSDLGVVLYEEQDADGNPTLAVYDMVNDGANGSYMFTISQDDLAPFVNNPPTENTLLNAGGHVAVYMLTTGELQINVGPDSEGKIHVKIFDGIPWSHVYGYVIDPE